MELKKYDQVRTYRPLSPALCAPRYLPAPSLEKPSAPRELWLNLKVGGCTGKEMASGSPADSGSLHLHVPAPRTLQPEIRKVEAVASSSPTGTGAGAVAAYLSSMLRPQGRGGAPRAAQEPRSLRRLPGASTAGCAPLRPRRPGPLHFSQDFVPRLPRSLEGETESVGERPERRPQKSRSPRLGLPQTLPGPPLPASRADPGTRALAPGSPE